MNKQLSKLIGVILCMLLMILGMFFTSTIIGAIIGLPMSFIGFVLAMYVIIFV